jgi:regulator of replication initiation timing
MNSFVDGLKNLFKEHYVEVPNKKLNIIDEQAKEIDALSEMAVDLNKENEALGAEVSKLKAKLVFESASDKMTDIQKEKFWTLAENVAFTDENDYSAKLKTIKESYFSTGRNVSNDDSKTIVEAPKGMDQYVTAISQNVKFI